MQPNTFVSILGWVTGNSYIFIFLAMVVEGPMITTAAGFASSLGYFNIFSIFILSVLADVLADTLYYVIGYIGRIKLIEKYGSKFGLTHKRIKKLDGLIYKHTIKSLVAIKLTPTLATPGLIIAGASKVPPKKYILLSLAMTIPKSLLLISVGFFSGKAHSVANNYLHYTKYALPLLAIVLFISTYLYQKISRFIARKIEKL